MSDQVKVRVDIANGIVEIEADSGSFPEVFERVEELLSRISGTYETVSNRDRKSAQASTVERAPEVEPIQRPATSASPRRGSGTRESYEVVDLGLSTDQRKALRDFFGEKKPRTQNDQTAVLMDWLKREIQLIEFDRNQVFTAFRTVDTRAPGRITSVLGNMASSGLVRNKGSGKYELTHIGEDHVKFNLPITRSDKS